MSEEGGVANGEMRKEGFANYHFRDDCASNIPAERAKSNVAAYPAQREAATLLTDF